MPNVTFTRKELVKMLLPYNLIMDCIEGETAIKGMSGAGVEANSYMTPGFDGLAGRASSSLINIGYSKRYLPQPNPSDNSPENQERYRSYVSRAVFYNVTGRTLDGFVGQVFMREPVVELPSRIEVIRKNADGNGLNSVQLAKRAVEYTLAYGRAGLLADYPSVNDPTSMKQLIDGDVQPILNIYKPWDIINWRTFKRGAKNVLSLVVIREYVDVETDEFETKTVTRYRVLKLDSIGNYVVEIHSAKDGNDRDYSDVQTFEPKDSNGSPLKDIPFSFIGAKNNDTEVDKAPFYDLASLNIAHYRNSADYEESVYITGQPTPVVAGLSEEWANKVLKGRLEIGSRAVIMLPVGATAEMLQTDPNTMPKEAMEQKERQMVALGAQIVQQAQVQRTATESIMEVSSQNSTLANVAKNVSAAFEYGLKIAAGFTGEVTDKIKFELNTEFELNKLSADDQSKVIAGWQKGAYTFTEMREVLRKAGTATLPDEVALKQIADEQATMAPLGMGLLPPIDPNADPNSDPNKSKKPDPNKAPAAHSKTVTGR